MKRTVSMVFGIGMKRIVSMVLVMMMAVGMVGAAIADSDMAKIGRTLIDSSLKILNLYYPLYSDDDDPSDAVLGRLYEFTLMYLTGEITYWTEMSELTSDADMLLTGYTLMMETLCQKYLAYKSGTATKTEFKNILFTTIGVIVNNSD